MPKHIYTVTCLSLNAKDHRGKRVERTRCWGWFSSLKEAKACVRENWGDLFEMAWYTYAVIEKMCDGPMALAEGEWWYQAIYTPGCNGNPKVRRIKKPKRLAQSVCFGMG